MGSELVAERALLLATGLHKSQGGCGVSGDLALGLRAVPARHMLSCGPRAAWLRALARTELLLLAPRHWARSVSLFTP